MILTKKKNYKFNLKWWIFDKLKILFLNIHFFIKIDLFLNSTLQLNLSIY